MNKILVKCTENVERIHKLEWGENEFNDFKEWIAKYLDLKNDPDVEKYSWYKRYYKVLYKTIKDMTWGQIYIDYKRWREGDKETIKVENIYLEEQEPIALASLIDDEMLESAWQSEDIDEITGMDEHIDVEFKEN